MSIYDLDIRSLDGRPSLLSGLGGKAALFVNTASQCGLTPQYTALEALHEKLSGRGFSVVGFPCNQFGGQEPGSPDEIAEFCSTNYQISFPLSEKIDVNGAHRHPVYAKLAPTADTDGHDGDVRWNFEKFVIDRHGNVVARFAPTVVPDDPAVLEAIERALD